MSDAPVWLAGMLDQHRIEYFTLGSGAVCACGERVEHMSGSTRAIETVHRAHVAQMVWDEIERRANSGALEFSYQLTIGDKPKVIPARSTDPDTSHAATRAITVKAGTQRALLLEVFAHADEWWHGPKFRNALTDEEAMEFAGGVSPLSEYSKRCSELREAGFIEPTGETRKGSSGMERIVSRITDKGREAVRGL